MSTSNSNGNTRKLVISGDRLESIPDQSHHPVNFVHRGEGPPVILVHGIAASLHNWHYQIPALDNSQYHPYALDLMGHGESAKPDDTQAYHIDHIYSHFENWIDSLSLTSPLVLIGHSLGCYLNLVYTLRHPLAVRGLVLIDPFYSPEQLSAGIKFSLRRPEISSAVLRLTPLWLIDHVLHLAINTAARLPDPLRRQVALDYKRANPNIVFIAASTQDTTPHLPNVAPPSLVIWGERDLTLHPGSFPSMISAMPNARGHPIPMAGHIPHLTRAQLVNEMVLEFLDQLHQNGDPLPGRSTTGPPA